MPRIKELKDHKEGPGTIMVISVRDDLQTIISVSARDAETEADVTTLAMGEAIEEFHLAFPDEPPATADELEVVAQAHAILARRQP
jgi:hypothetical protein